MLACIFYLPYMAGVAVYESKPDRADVVVYNLYAEEYVFYIYLGLPKVDQVFHT
jgi:hypothetical protein